jgi:hypothetical protein
MLRLKVIYYFIFGLFSFSNISAQNGHSIQLNGGLLSPRSSSKGYSFSIQYNYKINNTFDEDLGDNSPPLSCIE